MNLWISICLLWGASAMAEDSTQLFAAIRRSDVKKVEALLVQGTDPNSRNPDGVTALMYAAVCADARIMQVLLTHKADPNAKNSDGGTALLWAAGDPEKVKLLVRSGAGVMAKS